MLSKVLSGAIYGIDAYLVEVEVDLARGLPSFSIVGLPDGAVKESKDRVKAAIKNSGLDFPVKKITVNLAPADIKKEGTCFDLPIAIGIASAMQIVKKDNLEKYLILGELSLNGKLKPIKGVLSMAIAARQAELKGIILPSENASEAAVVEGVEVYPIHNLSQAISFLNEEITLQPKTIDLESFFDRNSKYELDFIDVKGQEHVKRALEVAAAGAHNIIMIGPPGSGKTMLAKRVPTILPKMTFEEAIQTTKIHSIAGLVPAQIALIATRPFRSPHHTISDAGLIGGGRIPRPGEVSISHNGVLFLDELPEFHRNVLEVIRQPIEDGFVNISRAISCLTFPAQFMLVAAMNPCPCGYASDPNKECSCTPLQIHRYMSKISGPLLDRIDIHIEVPPLSCKELTGGSTGDTSNNIQERVDRAYLIQQKRFKGKKIYANAQMNSRDLKLYCRIDEESHRLIEMAINQLGFSARAYDRILKVSRTIADLAGEESIKPEHISEAIQYRSLDRESWI